MAERITINGMAVGVRRAGSGAGAPLLLVHGHTGAKDDFDGVLDELAGDRAVIAVDLPGHGDSAGPDDPGAYVLDHLAQWLLQVSERLALGPHHLLGHSMGGLIVQRAALVRPDALASLILMGTGLGALRAEACEFISNVAAAAARGGAAAAFEESVRNWEDAPLDPELKARRAADRDYLRARYAKLNPAAIIGGARELAQAEPVAHRLRLNAPVLVIHGDQDYAWKPDEQKALAAAIPGARRVAVPFSYHSPQKENPDEWLSAVRSFLDEADRQRAALVST